MSKTKADFACAIILLVCSSYLIVELASAQQIRRYAGYYLYDDESYAEEGVRGKIYTIDPTLIGSDFMCEWVSIILEYWPNLYWLQVGYVKGEFTGYHLRYYYEYWDSRSYSGIQLRLGIPAEESWHTYRIVHPFGYGESADPEEWRFYVDGWLLGPTPIRVFPYVALDQQAFVETVSTSLISISGSHFKSLSYFTLNSYWKWVLWDTHVPDSDFPYFLIQISDSEFEAGD